MDNSEHGAEREPAPRREPRRLPWWGRALGGPAVLAVALVPAGRFGLLPSFGGLFGEETVDRSGPVLLNGLGAQAVTVNEERTKVSLRLPHAVLGTAALDLDRSYAVSKQRGLLDRLGDLFTDDPAGEQAVQRLAVQHITEAARDSGLVERTEKNTTTMLEGLLRSLGFQEVTVDYA